MCQNLWVLLQHSYALVTGGAEEPTILSGTVIVVQAQLLLLRAADATRSAQNRRGVLFFQAVQNERLRGLTCFAHAFVTTGGRVVVAVETRIFFGFKANSANAHARSWRCNAAFSWGAGVYSLSERAHCAMARKSIVTALLPCESQATMVAPETDTVRTYKRWSVTCPEAFDGDA